MYKTQGGVNMKIGVFGGSFNPPHKMHLNIGLELVNKQYVDKVIYVPTGSKYKYKNNLLPDKNRLEMLEILIKTQEYLDVNDYELKDEVVYTCETLAYFKELYPNDEIYFICGTDNLSYIDKWKNGEDILNNYKIIAMKRKGEDIEELLKKFVDYQNNIIVADVEQQDISSTDIREKLKNNENVLDLLDKEVYEYIRKNKLYE
ncbi:MAG: nicotinate (nicotinamide) nucleotide adenylyltransferase [Firmicutes bacterium]|nr:nicotinate (nicotinamide) nucleotide adenylyltransferase [Bacillota bacterium]